MILPVENILQNPELPTGCESVALTMVLNYYGQKLSKTEIADKYLKKDPENFVTLFKGDPHDISGDGIYAPGLTETANRFLRENGCSQKAEDLTGTALSELYPYLEQKIPIIVYDSVYLKTPVDVAEYVVNGKTWHFYHNEHCIVLCGYDPEKHRVLVSDALSKSTTLWDGWLSLSLKYSTNRPCRNICLAGPIFFLIKPRTKSSLS